jgi:transcriptional regulator with XRE-family HTH domain
MARMGPCARTAVISGIRRIVQCCFGRIGGPTSRRLTAVAPLHEALTTNDKPLSERHRSALWIGQIERAEMSPTLESIETIALALDIRASELIARAEELAN